MANHTLYLIDTSGLCYRAYYALAGLSTSYGQPTGAVYGFINILNKILKARPDYVACCFDVSRETFRQKKYAQYKMQRPPMPEALVSQMQLIRQVIAAYNIVIYELAGYEADDLIASLAQKAKESHWEVVMISSDKDILQLVDEKVKVFDPKKDDEGFWYDIEKVKARYGVAPERLIDIFSLSGDAADNIPGVRGIGEKTAGALIQEFGSVEGLINNVEKVQSESLRQAVKDSRDTIRLNYELLRLARDLDINLDLKALAYKEPDYEALFLLFKKLEFNSLLKKLPTFAPKNPDGRPKAESLEGSGKKEKVLSILGDKQELLFVLQEGVLYFSLDRALYSLKIEDQELQKVLADSQVRKISHNLKEVEYRLGQQNIVFKGMYFDVMLAAYLIEPSLPDFSLKELVFTYLDKRFFQDTLSPEESVAALGELAGLLEKKLKENGLDGLFAELELPLSSVLASMQAYGVQIDTAKLGLLSQELEKRLIVLRKEIYGLNSGDEFNLNSPKQLADVLFKRLKLPVVKKTKTGLSTDEEVLRKLSAGHALPRLILEYRSLSKLKGTYVDALPALVDERTGRIHATFDQTGTETGRLSSNNPNLQNIPARGDIAGLIRRAFIAGERHYLVSADYSQIELRILAHFSGDENLIAAFKKDLDVHRHSAGLIFGIAEDLVSDEMRDTAKRVNFGIIYGMSGFGLAKDLGIPMQEAQAFIDSYFSRYPKVKTFIEQQIGSARKLGYVKTLLGRSRYLREIGNKNNAIRSFAERQAVNSPIQGSAADLIKRAMVQIQAYLKEQGLKSRIIMQIHDELVFESPENEAQGLIDALREKMENAYTLKVPIKVNIKKGLNWQDMEPV